MLGHYLFFIAHLNRCIVFRVVGILSRWSMHYDATDIRRGQQELWIHFIMTFCNWVPIKYPSMCFTFYHFPIETLLYGIVVVLRPITYFYTLLRPGIHIHCFTILFPYFINDPFQDP